VKRWIALLAVLGALAAGNVAAAAAYVSDELVLGVFAEQNGQGQRLATLHSGASVETLGVNGDFTQVRLNDGITGWVKSAYLTTHEPAIVRIKQLQDELDRSRATTPALAEAAARSELGQLKRELAIKQDALDAATAAAASAAAAATATGAEPTAAPGAAASSTPVGVLAGMTTATSGRPWLRPGLGALAMLAALGCGFWLGYATLARRIRRKFGGIKVY
jgi:phage protein D